MVGHGEPDGVPLAVPGLGVWLTAGPEPLQRVLLRSGWDGHSPIRLAVDGLALDQSPYGQGGEFVPGDRFGQVLADLTGVEVHAPTGAVDWSSVHADITPGGGLPLQPGPRGASPWVRYAPRTSEALPWPDLSYAESRLAKLTQSARARLFGRARELVEDLLGARLAMGENMSSAVRETVVRVAHVLRWRGPAEADRLALELIAAHGSALAPTYTAIEVPAGADPTAVVTDWLATAQPTPVALRPQMGPGQVLVQFPGGAAGEIRRPDSGGQQGAWVVPDPEHFTVQSIGEWAAPGVPLIRLLDAPPSYETVIDVPDGPSESLYARAHGIVRQYGRAPEPDSDSAQSVRKRRRTEQQVHEDVAQTLVMFGQQRAHEVARSLADEFGFVSRRGGASPEVPGTPGPDTAPGTSATPHRPEPAPDSAPHVADLASQSGAGAPHRTFAERLREVEALAGVGRITSRHLAAARVGESVHAVVNLDPGVGTAEGFETWLRSGRPTFGSVRVPERSVLGQVVVTFPPGSGYDLGLLEGGEADGVLVVMTTVQYAIGSVVPDFPAPGSSWFFLVERPQQEQE